MVQIRVIVKLVCVAMMSVGVLMLPHDGVAKGGHTPDAQIVNPRLTAYRVVSCYQKEGKNYETV